MITSKTNPKIKYVKRLQSDRQFRATEQKFVAEGERWLREWSEHTVVPDLIFYTEQWADTAASSPIPTTWMAVADDVMATMSDVATPSGLLAIVAQPSIPLPEEATLLVVLDRIQDAGNLGTIIRTVAGAGADGVILASGCVDLFNPKTVRATMGTLLRLPIVHLSWDAIAERTDGWQRLTAELGGKTLYTTADWTQPSVLIVGNEANGVGADAQAISTSISIPMSDAESLNAAIATAVILFEAVRQRNL